MAHTHIIGQPQTGKTSYMLNDAIAAIHRGEAVLFVDANGEAVDELATYIPKSRYNQTVLFDLSREENGPIFNPLEDTSNIPLLAATVADTITDVSGFDTSASAGSTYFKHILWSCSYFSFAALAEAGEPLTAWRPLLTDKKARAAILKRVTDTEVLAFWEDHNALPEPKQRELIASCLNKATLLLSEPHIKRSLSQRQSSFNIKDTLKDGVFLIKLPQRLLSPSRVELYGSVMLSLLSHAAEARSTGVPLNIYLDDAWLWSSPILTKLLTRGPQANIHVTAAHQYINQLRRSAYDALVGSAELSIIFRTSRDDATTLFEKMDYWQKAQTRFDQLDPFVARKTPFLKPHFLTVAPLADAGYPQNLTGLQDIRWVESVRELP